MYDFDEIIDRRHTNALNTDGFRDYIFHADDSMTFPYKDEEFIRMWVADMEFATPDVVIDGIRRRLDRRIFGYTRVFEDAYYQAFAAWCRRRYGWDFPREQLVMSNGIIPALYELVEYISAPDEQVLFLTPSYAYFKYAADHNHRSCVCCDLVRGEDGSYAVDYDDLERKAADPRTTLFIFCNPHNPTGRVWRREELERIAAIAERYSLRVISDEIHCDLTRSHLTHTPMGRSCRTTGGSSPAWPPARPSTWRLSESPTSSSGTRPFGQVAQPPLQLRQSPQHRRRPGGLRGEPSLKESQGRMKNFAFTGKYLAEHLPRAGYRVSEATYLAWVDLSAYFRPEESLTMFFAYEAGVLLEGGNMFVQNSDCFIRLNLACPRSILEEGLRRICEAVNTRHREPYLRKA